VGPLAAAAGNANEFKRGRELSAWLGLVPRQHCSGNRYVRLGISKRGDPVSYETDVWISPSVSGDDPGNDRSASSPERPRRCI
jgi:hypothetical protein